MKGSGCLVGKVDVMKMEEQARTRGHFTVEYDCLCGTAVVTTEASCRILFLPFASFSYPLPLNSNRLGFDSC